MKELSLHILDIVQNSISAKAAEVAIEICESAAKNIIEITITDNGCGMDGELLKKVTDPFTTTRSTRKVGLGVPLFKLAAEQAGGTFDISSKVGEGTTVKATFEYDNIDRSPIGDMAGTLTTLISVNENVDFVYTHATDKGKFEFDTKQIREVLGGVALNEFKVLCWIEEFIKEGLNSVEATTYQKGMNIYEES